MAILKLEAGDGKKASSQSEDGVGAKLSVCFKCGDFGFVDWSDDSRGAERELFNFK